MAASSVIGQALLRLRLAAGLSQEALASRSGLSVRGISDLERGARSTPRLETIRLLADALGLDGLARAELLAAARPELAPNRPAASPSVAAVPSPLALPLTSLIGREPELVEIGQLLKRPEIRLLTLHGPGGVGKTRLALALARVAASDFADGVVFVDLAPIRESEFVLSTIATSLGVRADGSVADAIKGALRQQQVLLILDNFEQVTAAAPPVVDLLRACPGVKALVTSRAVLRASGEHAVPVAPLTLPERTRPLSLAAIAASDAVRLFRERAVAVQPAFALTEQSASAVGEICRRLDGLPLAIELAAARIRLLPPEELLIRLEPRLPMLRGGPVDQPDRLRTMRDAIDWSLDLLAPDERRFFASLAVFSGGFSIAAVEAVCGGTIDLLGALVDQSLVQARGIGPEGEARFAMLETIREAALADLEASGRSAEMRDRHAAYFGDLADLAYAELWGPRQGVWLSRLETEHDNLRAALTWLTASGQDEALVRLAGALGAFWLYRGHAAEGRATLEQVLARTRAGEVAPAPLARALLRLASVLAEQGAFERADELLEQVRDICRGLGDRRELGEVLSWMGAVAEYRGDDALAQRRYGEAYAVIRETNDDSLISYALSNLSDTAFRLGDLAAASRQGREALAAARAADDAISTIVALGVTAQVDLVEGRLDDAVAAFDESLALSVHTGYQSGIANSIGAFAAVASATGQPVRAAELLAAAQTVRESAGIHRSLNHRLIEDTLAAIKHRLSEAELANAWATGQSLTLAEMIDLAHSRTAGAGEAGKPGSG